MQREQVSGRESRHRRRRVLGGAGWGAIGLLAAGSLRNAAAQAEVVADELKIITYETFYGMDPVHQESPDYMRSVGAAEGLLRITPYGDVEADLADSFEMLDPFTWVVNLRPEVTFWSGKPVDAQAVVASLERARALAPFADTLLKGVRIEPEGEWSVRFTADAAIPGLPINLANSALVIHNAGSYGPQDNSFDLGAVDLTGPFKITAFEPRVVALLQRSEQHWGPRPRMHRIRFEEVSDIESRSLAALSGEAHIVRWISGAGARQVERSREMRLVATPLLSSTNVYLHTQKPPFDDVRVRQALAWAVDREELVTLALDGRGVPNPSWLGINPAYPEARRMGYTRQDLARAAQLLDEAGWRLAPGGRTRVKEGRPLRFRLVWWGGGRTIAEVLQGQWAKVGAEVAVEGAADYGFLQARRAQNDWDAFIEAWTTFGDPAEVLGRHVSPDGDVNYAKFRDPVLEQLLAGFEDVLDPEERRQQALKINERHAELMPFIPLAAVVRPYAVSRRVRNYLPHFLPWAYEVHPDLWVAA